MKHSPIIAMSLLFAVAAFSVSASGVVVNEVMFNPAGDDTGNEWVELYNGGDQDADVSGWEVYPDGTGYVTMPNGISIGAKQFMLVHLRSSGNNSSADVYQANGSSNMSNTSGSVALFSGEPGKSTIKSFVQWGRAGETWESAASSAGLWEKETFIDLGSFAEGDSIALQRDGVTGGGKNAWRISTTPTPKAANIGLSASNSPTPASSPSSSDSPLPHADFSPVSAPSPIPRILPVKTIKAYAGEDISSMAGIMINFLGRAKGLNDESIDSPARFFWNFGDGETQEGRSVAHTYRVPGTYLAGVHVASGEYAASDYVRVRIGPNLVRISDVVEGRDGYIRLVNGADVEADMSAWSIHDAQGRTFTIPPNTMLDRRGDIAILNSVSGLLRDGTSLLLNVFYPNGLPAFSYAGTTSAGTVENGQMRNEASRLREVPKTVLSSENRSQPVRSPTPASTPPAASSASSTPDAKEYAAAHSTPVGVPFMIAIGVSMLGAGGFLISKKFF